MELEGSTRRETRRWLIPVALALLVAFAGCSGGAGGSAQDATAGSQADLSSDDGGPSKTPAADSSSGVEMRERALIRTGTVALTVDDYDAARRNLTRATESLGGFVSDSSERVHTRENRSWTTGRLVLRVPKGNFSTLLSRAKRAGEVRKASTNTKDVTDKLVDLEARLANLRAQRDRLRDLYQRANDTDTVLDVQRRLSEVQSEIERLEAERKSLKREVAYSTITVELNEPRPERDTGRSESTAWYETGLFAAFVSSTHGVTVVLQGLAVAGAYAAPYVLVFGVPLGAGYVVLRRRRSTEQAATARPKTTGSSGGAELPDRFERPDETGQARDETGQARDETGQTDEEEQMDETGEEDEENRDAEETRPTDETDLPEGVEQAEPPAEDD